MLSSLPTIGLTLAALTSALPSPSSHKRTQVGAPYLRSSVTTHSNITAWAKNRRPKRQDESEVEYQEKISTYSIEIEMGTPPQNITVILDTGSEELWVNPTCDNAGSMRHFCGSFPPFDYTESSTAEDTGSSSHISYGKGSVKFEYYTDVVGIGAESITDQTFGIAVQSVQAPLGILGLAPPHKGAGKEAYSYILDSMASQGLIDSRAFSLDLRDVDSPDGSIIFGGIDTGKYIGSLEKCPMLTLDETPNSTDRYWIYLNSIGITLPSDDSGNDGQSVLIAEGDLAVFLDSGSSYSWLPPDVFEGIGAVFPEAEFDFESGSFVVDCSAGEGSGSMDFGFGGKTISVPFKDFIWQHSEDDDGLCVVGVMASDDANIAVLGDTFLRAAYVVYDQDNRNLHLAEAANCGQNLVAISSGVDAVPSVTGDCTASTLQLPSITIRTATGPVPTVTADIGSLTSAEAPGPERTQAATFVPDNRICLTCGSTATVTAAPSERTCD